MEEYGNIFNDLIYYCADGGMILIPALRNSSLKTLKPEDEEGIALKILKKGAVAFPTETVYGLAADALNPAAVENIYR